MPKKTTLYLLDPYSESPTVPLVPEKRDRWNPYGVIVVLLAFCTLLMSAIVFDGLVLQPQRDLVANKALLQLVEMTSAAASRLDVARGAAQGVERMRVQNALDSGQAALESLCRKLHSQELSTEACRAASKAAESAHRYRIGL